LRLDLFNHSPTGFSWGYGGSGPAQLAIALLADALGDDDDRAIRLHQCFKFKVVACWPEGERWWITAEQIAAVAEILGENRYLLGTDRPTSFDAVVFGMTILVYQLREMHPRD
jgi:hypothetical protein